MKKLLFFFYFLFLSIIVSYAQSSGYIEFSYPDESTKILYDYWKDENGVKMNKLHKMIRYKNFSNNEEKLWKSVSQYYFDYFTGGVYMTIEQQHRSDPIYWKSTMVGYQSNWSDDLWIKRVHRATYTVNTKYEGVDDKDGITTWSCFLFKTFGH